jgi:hypothetical protein
MLPLEIRQQLAQHLAFAAEPPHLERDPAVAAAARTE